MEESLEETEQLNNEEPESSSDNGGSKKSAKKNYIYNMIYQVFALIVPLVVTPYVSRVLGSDGIGEYSFSYSIIYYFVLLGAFGFGYYAQREIARFQDNKYEQTKVFWEIMLCRLVTVVFALVLNNIFVVTKLYGDYTILMAIFNINIVATMIDVAYLYHGNEEFKLVAIVNVIVKALGVAAVFIFVKNENDVWIYTICNCAILFGANLLLWFFVPKMIVKVNPKEFHVFRHFLPSLRLFIPTIAVSIYTVLDRTLIGIIVNGETTKVLADGTVKIVKNSDVQNGYYEQSEKIVKMSLTVLTSLGAVMIPKNSYFFKNKQYDKVKENIMKALNFVFVIGFPIMFGLMAVAHSFSPWFFGPGYDEVPLIIMIFSPLIMAIGLNNVFGIQYLLPAGKDNVYAISVLIGALVNLSLNLLMIPFYGALGAAIASVIAEIGILIFQMIYLRKEFSYKQLILPFIKYLILSGIMFSTVYLLDYYFFDSTILNSFILVAIGVAVYFVLLLIVRDKFLFDILNKFKSIFKRILRR